MRSAILVAGLLMIGSVLAAEQTAAHGGHDHAAMMAMMARPGAWSEYPLLKMRTSGERRDQMVTKAVLQNIIAPGIDAWSNNLQDESGHRQLPLDMSGAKLDKPASGGFHWLSAREEADDRVVVASTVHYFGERGAQDPTALFMLQKHELEIIPQPYPREHSRYRAGEDWKFLLRFNGQPLPNQKLLLQTQNGSKAELVSDAQGVVVVHLPDDFMASEDEKKEGGAHNHGARRGADFVLVTEHPDGGRNYLTAFNSAYGTNAYDQRSLALGVGFTLLGMTGAVPLLRQRREQETKETGDA